MRRVYYFWVKFMEIKDVIYRIGYFRNKKNLSARELSKKLGNNQTYITRMESGEFNLTIEKLLEMLEIFDVEPAEFFADNYDSYSTDKSLEEKLKKLTPEDKEIIKSIIDRMLLK